MKKFYKKIKAFIENSIYNNTMLLIISILTGVAVWGYVTQKEYPDSTETIKGIHIDYEASTAGTPAEEEGYKIYESDVSDVDIKVTANRTKLAFLNKDDFYAKVTVDNYSSEQPVVVSLQVFKADENDVDCNWQVIGNAKATVYFYKEITRTIEIKDENINAPNITAASGYKLKNKTCDSLSITGPEPYINSIAGCTLNMLQSVSYNARKTISVDASLDNITFYDEDGNNINNTLRPYFINNSMRINKKELAVTMYISKTHKLDINYSITDAPSYFNQDFIRKRLTLDPKSIWISSDDPSVADMVTLPVSTDQNISLKDIGLDFSTTFDINKALESYPKLTNDSNVSKCIVSFDNSGLTSKTFQTLSNFSFKNPYSSKYKAEPITQCLNDVTIIGPASDIAKITANDLILEIDISKSSTSTTGKPDIGRNNYEVSVRPPEQFKNVWVFGHYTAEVEISELNEPLSTNSYSSSTSTANIQ